MFKPLINIIILIGVVSLISAFIPNVFTQEINDAIIYFLDALGALGFLFHVETFYRVLQILMNFYTGIATFWVFHWATKHFTS